MVVAALMAVTLLRSASLLHYSVYTIDEERVVAMALGFIDFDLNPRWFNYHPLPMYLLGALYYLLYQVYHLLGVVDSKVAYAALLFGRDAHLYIPAKLLFSFVYTSGCFVLALTAFRHTGSRLAAVLVGGMSLLAPEGMAAANQVKIDTFVFLFLSLTVYFACFAAKRRRSFVLAVVCCAAAFASKMPAIVLLPVLLAVLAVDAWRGHYPWRYLGYALLLFPFSVAAFMPYLVIDPAAYQSALARVLDRASGQRIPIGKEYHAGWFGKWTHLLGLTVRLGGIGGLIGLLGWGIHTALKGRATAMAALFPLAYLTAFSTSATVDGYWLRPMIPFCFLFAVLWAWELGGHERVAGWARALFSRMGRQVPPDGVRRIFMGCAVLVLIGLPLRGLAVYQKGLSQRGDDTRVTASAWIADNIPAGSTVVLEGHLLHYLPKVFIADMEIMLKEYGYYYNHVSQNRLLVEGMVYALRKSAGSRPAYRVALLDRMLEHGYGPEGVHLKRGDLVVISSAIYDRFYSPATMKLAPELAARAQWFYAVIRRQEHVRTFTGRGPTLEIYRMRIDMPPT